MRHILYERTKMLTKKEKISKFSLGYGNGTQSSASHLAKSMADIFSAQATKTKKPVEVAFNQLQGALTIEELEMLPLEELLQLPEDERNILIGNIQEGRPNLSDQDSFCFRGSFANGFLEDLNCLISQGVSLTRFANFDKSAQNEFTSSSPLIVFLMKNGIEFDKLAQLSLGDFRDVAEESSQEIRNIMEYKEKMPENVPFLIKTIRTRIENKIAENEQRSAEKITFN